VNPLLLLTADVYAAPVAAISDASTSCMSTKHFRDDTGEGQPGYVVVRKRGHHSEPWWVDRGQRATGCGFIQSQKVCECAPNGTVYILGSEGSRESGGFDVPTEFLGIAERSPRFRSRTKTFASRGIIHRAAFDPSPLERHPRFPSNTCQTTPSIKRSLWHGISCLPRPAVRGCVKGAVTRES